MHNKALAYGSALCVSMILGIPLFVYPAYLPIFMRHYGDPVHADFMIFYAVQYVCPVITKIVILLIAGGVYSRMLQRALEYGQPRCSRCGYSLRGLQSPRCPECGLQI